MDIIGIRHLVLDHKFPFGDYVEAQNRGLHYPVTLGSRCGHTVY